MEDCAVFCFSENKSQALISKSGDTKTVDVSELKGASISVPDSATKTSKSVGSNSPNQIQPQTSSLQQQQRPSLSRANSKSRACLLM